MRGFITRGITQLTQLGRKKASLETDGTFFISPKPPYYSQFADIYPQSIKIDTPLTNKAHIKAYGAKDSQEFTFWAWRNCGIVCTRMVLESQAKAQDKSIMDLTKEGIEEGGYILYEDGQFVDKGWIHKGLVSLLGRYGIQAEMKKWQTLESVAQDILKNKPVIISATVPGRSYIKEDGSFEPKDENTKTGGHLMLGIGVEIDGKDIKGVYVHDPRGLEKYQADTFIPAAAFNKIFSQRTIVCCLD